MAASTDSLLFLAQLSIGSARLRVCSPPSHLARAILAPFAAPQQAHATGLPSSRPTAPLTARGCPGRCGCKLGCHHFSQHNHHSAYSDLGVPSLAPSIGPPPATQSSLPCLQGIFHLHIGSNLGEGACPHPTRSAAWKQALSVNPGGGVTGRMPLFKGRKP